MPTFKFYNQNICINLYELHPIFYILMFNINKDLCEVLFMSKKMDKIRQANLIKDCLEKDNVNDGKDIDKKLDDMRVKCRGQDKVLLNMMLSDR